MVDVPWESEEKRNYICIQTLFADVVSENLRNYFKQEWNTRYQACLGAWDDTNVSGQQLFNRENSRTRPSKNMLQSKFQHGDTSQWDCSVLFDAIRFSNSIGSSLNPTIKTALDCLRTIRNQLVGHPAKATLTDVEFQTIINDVENSFKTLGIPVHDLTQIRKKRNRYKSFQVLPAKPTHEVVYRTKKTNEVMQDLEKLRNNNDGKLTYYYISGNPGSGKSQLARQLAEDLFQDMKGSKETVYVMTLHAKDVDTLLNSYERFCRRLNCDENVLQNLLNSSKPKEEKIKDLRSLIATRIKNWKTWWIIVDNVEELDIISPLLPQMGDEDWNNGQIILTTQNIKSVPSDSLLTKHISLSRGMNDNECRQLLAVLSGTNVDKPELDHVAKQLDHQPLALAGAAVYVKELEGSNFSWRDYLEKLANGKRNVTEEQLCQKNLAYSSTMSAAMFLAVQKSAEKSSILKETFNLFSFISFEPLPIDIIVDYIKQLDQTCDKEDIYLVIKHCSLFLFDESEDHIDVRIHRVVHEAVTLHSENKRTKLGKSSKPGFLNKGARVDFLRGIQNVVQALYHFKRRDDKRKIIPHLKAFDKKGKDLFAKQQPWYSLTSYFKTHEIFELFNFFAQCLREYCEYKLALKLQNINLQLHAENKDDVTLACILSEVCVLHIDLGKFDKAKGHGRRALEIRKKILRPTHVGVSGLYNNLGIVYHNTCELEQAQAYHHLALEIRIEALGPTHVNVGSSYNNLGTLYNDMGELEQAKDYHQRALEIRIKALGPTHADVGASYNNLGLVYQHMGELVQAKYYQQRALEIRIKALGQTHADVGTSYNNLGNVYQDMCELEQAKDCHQRALEIVVQALGPTHIKVGTAYNDLGNVCQDMGELEQAKYYHQCALEIKIKALGPTHTDVGASYNNLGLVHQDMGKLEQAKDYYQRALEIVVKAFGPTHNKVGTSYNDLGNVCQDMGELEQAKDYHQRALENRINALGSTHADVGASYNNLGLVHQDMGELEQAKDCHQRALEIRIKTLGPTHAGVGASYNNLGLVYQDMGELAQAKTYHQQALEIRMKTLGPTHADVGASYNNLGLVYQDMGKFDQAKDYHQRALEIRLKTIGPSHSDVGASYNNLGLLYLDVGELEKAEGCHQRGLFIRIKALGPTHADVGASYSNLGLVYQDMGELERAKDCYQRSLEIRIKALGPTHADVGASYNNLGLVYQDMGEIAQAKDYHQRALEIRIEALSPTHVKVGISYSNLGAVYQEMGELEQAKDYHQLALEIRIKALGPSHRDRNVSKLQKAMDYHQGATGIES